MDNSGTSTEHDPGSIPTRPARGHSALSSPAPIPTTTAPSSPQPSIAAQAPRRPPRTSRYPSTATARTSLPRRRRLCQGVVRPVGSFCPAESRRRCRDPWALKSRCSFLGWTPLFIRSVSRICSLTARAEPARRQDDVEERKNGRRRWGREREDGGAQSHAEIC